VGQRIGRTRSHSLSTLRDSIVSEIEGRMDLDALALARVREKTQRRLLANTLAGLA